MAFSTSKDLRRIRPRHERSGWKGAPLYRISGLALLSGSGLFVCYVILRSAMTAGPDPAAFSTESLWAPVNAIGVMGAVLVLIGLPAVAARIAGNSGLPAVVGVALLALAWMFFGLFLSLYGLLVLPWLAEQAPSLVAPAAPPAAMVIAFIVGLLAWVVGSVLLAIPFLQRRARPVWVGYVLPTSGAWMILGNAILAPSGPASSLAVNLLSNLGPIILLAGLGYLGYRMWSEPSHRPPSITAGGSRKLQAG